MMCTIMNLWSIGTLLGKPLQLSYKHIINLILSTLSHWKLTEKARSKIRNLQQS